MAQLSFRQIEVAVAWWCEKLRCLTQERFNGSVSVTGHVYAPAQRPLSDAQVHCFGVALRQVLAAQEIVRIELHHEVCVVLRAALEQANLDLGMVQHPSNARVSMVFPNGGVVVELPHGSDTFLPPLS